jgi:acyl-CoA synthetase (AMP-forming)/AMP-acid ligase II
LAQQAPQQVCLRLLFNQQPEQAITYQALLQRSAGYAQALARAGIRPGEVVILILQHGEALVYAFFGAILHGAVPSIMPFLTEKLSPEQYRRSLAALFEISAPAAVITYPEFIGEVQQAISTGGSIRSVLLSSQVASPPSPPGAASVGRGAGGEGTESLLGLQRRPSDIVLLQHSSGTTGLQKGVAHRTGPFSTSLKATTGRCTWPPTT